MPINFNAIIDQDLIWLVLKIIYLFAALLFVTFAIIVRRQIYLMISTLDGSLNLPLKTLGLGFLLLTIAIFFLSLVVL